MIYVDSDFRLMLDPKAKGSVKCEPNWIKKAVGGFYLIKRNTMMLNLLSVPSRENDGLHVNAKVVWAGISVYAAPLVAKTLLGNTCALRICGAPLVD